MARDALENVKNQEDSTAQDAAKLDIKGVQRIVDMENSLLGDTQTPEPLIAQVWTNRFGEQKKYE